MGKSAVDTNLTVSFGEQVIYFFNQSERSEFALIRVIIYLTDRPSENPQASVRITPIDILGG